MFDNCLIMAGGSGTRLWPASSSRLPKQFLPAMEGKSFFFLSLERALALGERVIVIAGKKHINHVVSDAAKFSAADKKKIVVIEEPIAKNTAPAVACAVVFAKKSGSMIVLTSDHIIEPLKVFKKDAEAAAKAAADDKLVIFGITPSRPETGYGYIETPPNEKNKSNIYNVKAFREKPDSATAKKYAANKHFFWNSGMFVFNTAFMAEQFKTLSPDVFKPFEKLNAAEKTEFTVSKGIKVLKNWNGLENAYKKSAGISFDYAIAEKCKKTAMVAVNFNWIDIGNWEEYIKICGEKNSDVFKADANNCYVDSDIPAALAGVDDLIVVIRSGKNGEPASALITKKGQTHKVKDIVEQIKIAGKNEIL